MFNYQNLLLLLLLCVNRYNSDVFFSYALFDMEGKQVPQELVTKVGQVFEVILEEVSWLQKPTSKFKVPDLLDFI